MIKLVTPSTTSILPNPEFSDVENTRNELNIKRSMDGTKRVYVKRAETKKLVYSFDLTKMKALELRAFIELYYDSAITLTNHKDEVWIVRFVANPFDFVSDSAAQNLTGNELVSITLQMEGSLQ